MKQLLTWKTNIRRITHCLPSSNTILLWKSPRKGTTVSWCSSLWHRKNCSLKQKTAILSGH